MRRIPFFIASLLVSGLFLWLALRDVPLEDVSHSIGQANGWWVGVAFLCIVAGLWTRAVRWRGLLGFRVPLGQAFHILNITFLVNQLPFRAGELARSLLATRANVPIVTAATSIVVERVLDTLLVVILLAVALSHLPNAPLVATQAATLFGVAAVLAFTLLIIFARRPHLAHQLLDWAEKRLPLLRRMRLRRLLDNVIEGLQPLTSWSGFLHAVGWTIIAWALSLAEVYALYRALPVGDVDILLSVVLAVTLASFSIAIPVTVAAIGPFEGAVRLAGEAVGMSPAIATSLGFLFHGTTVMTYAILGMLGLLVMGVSLGDMLSVRDTVES
jgi:uncharacterized protein (TIRG00374 family)